jgi:hypothetical protein
MYPEARENEAPLEMEDTRSMDFEKGERPPPDPDTRTSLEEEEGWRKRDQTKPRSL